MGIITFAIFTSIWYLPLFIMHRRNLAEPMQYYWKAFGMGFLAAILSCIVELTGHWFLDLIGCGAFLSSGNSQIIFSIFDNLIIVACVEEMLKWNLGSKILRRVPELSETGCMLILGMTGLGFEFFESVCGIDADITSIVLSGITFLHVFFQMWMGRYIFRAWQNRQQENIGAYKKNMCIALCVPITVHFAFDWMLHMTSCIQNEDMGVLCMILGLLLSIAYMVITLRMAGKVIKEEKAFCVEPQRAFSIYLKSLDKRKRKFKILDVRTCFGVSYML